MRRFQIGFVWRLFRFLVLLSGNVRIRLCHRLAAVACCAAPSSPRTRHPPGLRHPPFGLRHPPSAIRHPPSAIRHSPVWRPSPNQRPNGGIAKPSPNEAPLGLTDHWALATGHYFLATRHSPCQSTHTPRAALPLRRRAGLLLTLQCQRPSALSQHTEFTTELPESRERLWNLLSF